jgi:hypothetical protein
MTEWSTPFLDLGEESDRHLARILRLGCAHLVSTFDYSTSPWKESLIYCEECLWDAKEEADLDTPLPENA